MGRVVLGELVLSHEGSPEALLLRKAGEAERIADVQATLSTRRPPDAGPKIIKKSPVKKGKSARWYHRRINPRKLLQREARDAMKAKFVDTHSIYGKVHKVTEGFLISDIASYLGATQTATRAIARKLGILYRIKGTRLCYPFTRDEAKCIIKAARLGRDWKLVLPEAERCQNKRADEALAKVRLPQQP